jgi:methionyl-tRNA synthetase
VWFDALLNYYSALSYAPAPARGASAAADAVGSDPAAEVLAGGSDPAAAVHEKTTAPRAREGQGVGHENPLPSRARVGQPFSGNLTDTFWPADVHLIAKDILRFHTVYWPALLMAAGIELPKRVFVHGYLLMDGEKMSKSLGNVLDPFAVIDRFGADALRFYLLRDVPFGQDGSVSTAAFEQRYESELANEYGNLASRTIAMIVRYRDGVLAEGEPDGLLHDDFHGLPQRVSDLLDRVELTGALDEIWQRVRRLNRYVEEQAPWRLAKDLTHADDLDRVLSTLAEGLRVVSVLLHPYLPDSTERLLAVLGAPDTSFAAAGFGAGTVRNVQPLEPLFPKKDANEPVGQAASA